MAEPNTDEADKATALVEANFGSGFTDTPLEKTQTVVDEPKTEDAPKPTTAEPVATPEKPKYARVTEKDWSDLKATVGRLPGEIAKLTGAIPKADLLTQQIIEKVRAETPAGLAVEFLKEDFAELAEDYPELADRLEKVLNKAKVKGTGAAPAPPAKAEAPAPLVGEDFDKAVNAAVEKRERQKADDALKKAHPDWLKTVGAPIAHGTTEPVDTDWRKWLKTQSAEYQKEISETDDPAVVHASLDKWEASKTIAPAPARPDRAAARRAIVENAVTPRTDGAAPPLNQPMTAEEAFLSV